jgi:hypothetical protein
MADSPAPCPSSHLGCEPPSRWRSCPRGAPALRTGKAGSEAVARSRFAALAMRAGGGRQRSLSAFDHHSPLSLRYRRPAPKQASRYKAKRGYCSSGPRWRRRGAQGLGWHAQRASKTDFVQLSERSGRRPRSEFCTTPQARAPQSSPSLGRTADRGRLLASPNLRFLAYFFWRSKRSDSPDGANSRLGLARDKPPPASSAKKDTTPATPPAAH